MIFEELNKLSHISTLDLEVWKPISGNQRYEISNYGRVKRLAYTGIAGNQTGTWEQYYPAKMYTLNGDTQGYPQVRLFGSNEGEKVRVARVHRLVAEHFLHPPTNGLVEECKSSGLSYVPVEHKDDDPRNPHIDNLRYCSTGFNNKKSSLQMDYSDRSGSNQHMAELTEGDVKEILVLLDEGILSQTSIGNMFGVKQITISNIKTGRSWAWFTGIPIKARGKKKRAKSLMERSVL